MQDKLVFLLQELHSDLKFHNELFKLRFDQSKFRSICKKGTKMWHSTQEDIPSAVFSTIFWQLQANTCGNFELDEEFGCVRQDNCYRGLFMPDFFFLLKISEILS